MGKAMQYRLPLPLLVLSLLPACAQNTDDGASISTSSVVTRPAGITLPKLAFGAAWANGAPGNEEVRGVEGWVVNSFDPGHHGGQVRDALAAKKVPLIYFYIAAKTSGLQDCNVGAPPEQTLCHGGAAYIRNNLQRIVSAHADAASKYSAALGGAPGLVHVEPDWYQYVSREQTAPLTWEEAGRGMNQIMGAIKKACPSCAIVVDISPWAGDLKSWFSSLDLSLVTYGGLVGKRFPPAGVDGKSYADMSNALGKPLVVSDVYGAGGPPMGYDYEWDDLQKLDDASNQGVAVLVQPNAAPDHYRQVISSYRARAGSSPGAPGVTTSPPPSSNDNPTPPQQTPPPTGDWGFAVSPNISENWVEVSVTPPSGATIGKVEAIVNSKQYETLPKTTWGTYAKAVQVARGASVVFRAWDGAGKSHDSGAKTW